MKTRKLHRKDLIQIADHLKRAAACFEKDIQIASKLLGDLDNQKEVIQNAKQFARQCSQWSDVFSAAQIGELKIDG